MSSAPPGWYPDPQQPATQRYWDGYQWTQHTAPGARQSGMSILAKVLIGFAVFALLFIGGCTLIIGGTAVNEAKKSAEQRQTFDEQLADDGLKGGATGQNTTITSEQFASIDLGSRESEVLAALGQPVSKVTTEDNAIACLGYYKQNTSNVYVFCFDTQNDMMVSKEKQ
jgi:Protein of unknown function (DUF2510)